MKIEKSILSAKLAKIKMAIPAQIYDKPQGALFKDGKIMAQSTEIGIITSLPEDVEAGEKFVLPMKAINMISSLPDGEVEIVNKDKQIHISSGSIKSKFSQIDSKSFITPKPIKVEKSNFSIEANELKSLVMSVMYAASNDPVKPVFNGVLFEAKNNTLNIIAIDGYRLAWNKTEHDGEFKFIIPKKSLEKLLRLDISGKVQISIGENEAVFTSEEYTVYTRLIAGEFFDYENSFPNYETQLSISKTGLQEAMARILTCTDSPNIIPVKINLDDESVNLSFTASVTDYIEKIDIIGKPDAEITIGFNVYYLQDAIKSHNSEIIKIAFGSDVQPMTITDGSLMSLVLPVRLNKA